jgi:hypothetical protein
MVVVMAELAELPPLVTLSVCGDAPIVKFGETPVAVTVSVTVVVSVVPEVPVTVIG